MAKTTTILTPIHTAEPASAELRFFASPLPSDDLPWHSQDDLLSCMGLTRPIRRRFQAMNREREFAGHWLDAKTVNGSTIIASHDMAQGLMAAVTATGQLPAGFQRHYAEAFAAAFSAILSEEEENGSD